MGAYLNNLSTKWLHGCSLWSRYSPWLPQQVDLWPYTYNANTCCPGYINTQRSPSIEDKWTSNRSIHIVNIITISHILFHFYSPPQHTLSYIFILFLACIICLLCFANLSIEESYILHTKLVFVGEHGLSAHTQL
jgi:hypothetical protein